MSLEQLVRGPNSGVERLNSSFEAPVVSRDLIMARLRSSPHTNKLQSSPRNSPRNHQDSPSRQLELDLERTFANIRLHDQESQKLYVYHRKVVQDELDAKEYAQAVVHKAGIDDALAKHDIVRQQAVAVLEAHIREEEERRRREEEERRRREAEEKRRLEEERRIREENERKAREAREKAEAARRAAEERARAEQEEREQKQRENTAKREQEAKQQAEADATAAKKKQADDAQAAAEKEVADRAAAAKAAGFSNPDLPWSSNPQVRQKHYLDIHQKLKAFRKEFWAAAKKDQNLKHIIGDMRRAMRTEVGKFTIHDKQTNSLATNKIKAYLVKAKDEISSPPVALSDYLPPHLSLLDKNTTKIPALLLYLVSILSKALISAFTGECSVNPLRADPLGTMAAQIFSLAELQFHRNVPSPNSGQHYDRFGGNAPTPPMTPSSVSLISILMAKFHATAPILFGINGSETTQQGRVRLGWRREDGAFVPTPAHYDRLVGLAAGYAAISLRNFSKAKNKTNPYPPIHFWESLMHILNTPSNQVQTSHILLLKNMLEFSLDRFILFFGSNGIAALRGALIQFPKTIPSELATKPEARSLALLAETWRTEKNFSLT